MLRTEWSDDPRFLFLVWCFPPGNGLLTGVGLPVIVSAPAGECWPELGADVEAVLRRTNARRRWQFRAIACSGEDNPYRSWGFPPGNGPLTGVAVSVNRLSSCERIFAGAERGCGGCPPTNEGSSEVSIVVRSPAPARTTFTGAGALLRRTGISPELGFR